LKTIIKRTFFSFSYRFLFRFPIILKTIVLKNFLKKDSFDRKTKQKTTGKRNKRSFLKKMKTLTSLNTEADIYFNTVPWTELLHKKECSVYLPMNYHVIIVYITISVTDTVLIYMLKISLWLTIKKKTLTYWEYCIQIVFVLLYFL